MKILKFGGSSVGTPESILRVKEIVSSRQEPSIVVVSALGGVTDQLIRASKLAAAGDAAFRDEVAQLRARHRAVCEAVVPAAAVKTCWTSWSASARVFTCCRSSPRKSRTKS